MSLLKDIVTIEKGRKYNLLEKFQDGAIRVFQANDFRNENKLLYTFEKDGVLANDDDILLVWDGSVGQMGFGKSGYVGSTMVKLKVKNKKEFSPFFIYKFLQTKSEYLKRKSTGATIMHINRKSLEQLEIPSLPFNRQIYLANILDKAESLVEQRKQSILLLDELLRSTFIEMFGDPNLNQKGWEKCSLESLCERIVDCPHETPVYPLGKTGFYCVRSSDIQNGEIDFNQTREVSEETYIDRIKRYEPQAGEVVYTREGGRLGNAARVPIGKKVCLGQRMMLFIANKKISNNEFIWALLNSTSIKKRVENISGGGAAPRINISELRKLQVFQPPVKLQAQFAEIVLRTETLKEQYKISLTELENLYDSLSQEAFKA